MTRLTLATATALLIVTGASAMQILPPDLTYPSDGSGISTKNCTQVVCTVDE